MRIAIVNDLQLAVHALRKLVETTPDAEVAWVAQDGEEALARCRADVPDLVLMDLVMPKMDGVEATRRIMQEAPCPILVVTATVEGNASRVYHALGAGALDAVSGPTLAADGALQDTEPVLRKIRTLRRLLEPLPSARTIRERASSGAFPPPHVPAPRLVAVGASTGGPQAIVDLVRGFGEGFRPPVLVVQHLDEAFVPGLVTWLTSQTGWPAAAIRAGDGPAAGEIRVASSRDHLVMGLARRMRYEAEPKDIPFRPSVDAFFLSLRRAWPTPGVAVLLTGMGQDGAKGLLALRQSGWATLAQDEATSVVYGMPRAAMENGAACCAVAIEGMGRRVQREYERLETAAAAAAAEGKEARP